MNEIWEIDRPEAEWFAVLEPAGRRRLGEVCQLIAAHASRPRVRPARLLGKDCELAGTFLTIRGMLDRAGAPVSRLRPTSPLGPWSRLYPGVFLGPISRLAPGAMPPVHIHTPVYDWATAGLVLGLLSLGVGWSVGWATVGISGALLAVTSDATTCYAAQVLDPASVEIEGLHTFRELVHLLSSSKDEPLLTR